MSRPHGHFYEFGDFRLDANERVLLRDGHPVPLTPKAVETLLALVENRGHISEKDELLSRVWPGVFVEEATLAKNISTLRQMLGDSLEQPQYIETIAKRGYRFIAPVREVDQAPPVAPSPAAPPYTKSRMRWWILAAACVALLVVAGYMLRDRIVPRTSPAAGQVVLMVLPFVNLSGDAKQEYFSDGLTDELINRISRLQPDRLAVIARTTAMHYKNTTKSAAEISAAVGVDYILEGSVRREGSRVRVGTQLIRAGQQTPFWAENFEREVSEILPLQTELARAIAGRIGIELTEENRAGLSGTGPISPEAYEDYLKGRFFWNKMTVEGFQKAIQHFEAAIHKNPEYAEAYAGLADSYANLGLWGLPGREALRKAKAAAEKAVAIRESLAEGHASRAFIAMSYEWNWRTAEREFQRALELNPGYAIAHHRYGYYLMLMGRWDEAGTELKQAQELDPLSMIINANVGFRFYMMRQYDAAIEHWNKNLEMDPGFMLLYGYRGMAYVMKGMHREALADFEKALSLSGATAGTIGAVGYTYGVMGRTQEARKQLTRLRELEKQKNVSAFYVALLYTGLGDKDQAFAWLDKAYEERSGYLMEIHVDPMFDPLRSDPRFHALVRRLGLEAIQPIR